MHRLLHTSRGASRIPQDVCRRASIQSLCFEMMIRCYFEAVTVVPCFHSNLIGEVCVLEDMTSHLPVIEVRIEECRGKAM